MTAALTTVPLADRPQVVTRVVEQLTRVGALTVAAHVRRWAPPTYGAPTLTPYPWQTDPPDLGRSARRPPQAPMLVRAASPDPRVVARLVGGLVPDHPALPQVVPVLVRNPALTPDGLARVVDVCAATDLLRLDPGGGLAGVDVISRAGGDQRVVGVWARVAPAPTLTRYGWDPFGGPDAAADLIPTWADPTYPGGPGVLAAAAAAGVSDRVLGRLPAWCVTRVLEVTPQFPGCAALADRVVGAACARLGSDPQVWGVLVDLWAGFTGSFDDLLSAAAGVCANG